MVTTSAQLLTSFLQLPDSNKLDSAQLGRPDLISTRRNCRSLSLNCRVKPPVNASPIPDLVPAFMMRGPHKFFDQAAVITVRAGDGDLGAVLSVPGGGKADDREKGGGRLGRRKRI
ncbi:hypothetical protein MLD38_034980 [Melastoma candidum]|uniref:Uncharacterized protein n=1 Tax=Melastoma candidum TaxID=119954 RepID=A0ACB9MDJ1_9MYRT|nr:hypothetical protein MLD38_034980 [Melastoma candidum]